MKILRMFDSLKFVRAMFVAVVAIFAFAPAHAATLPAGYTELEYIESTGTQYIDFTDAVSITFPITRIESQARVSLSRVTTTRQFVMALGNANVAHYVECDTQGTWGLGTGQTGTPVSVIADKIYNLKSIITPESHTLYVDGVLSRSINEYQSGTNLVPRTLFSLATSGSYKGTYVRIHAYTLYNNNDLILNLIPAKRNSDNIIGMYDTVSGQFFTNAGTGEFVAGPDVISQIKIATTKYNEQQFAPVKTDLSAAMNAVDDVVSRTMSQAQAIDTIATSKQTRPDETCPPFKKCLLVEDEQGVPHWYEIYDPINDFLNPILAAAGLSGNQGAPTRTTHTSGSNTIYDTYNGFYKTNNIFKNQYVSGTVSAQNRPFGPTTLPRCDDNATRTTMPTNAGICYNTGGMFRELTGGPEDDAGEWAVVYNGNEGGASLGITPGVVYGVAKCTTVGQHTTQMTGDVADGSNYWWPKKLTEYSNTTLSSLIEQYPNVVDVFNTLPNPVGTDEKPGYPRANYRNCWCKMTAIGVPGAGDDFTAQAANGTIMSVSGDWVFDRVIGDLNNCVGQCAYYCTSLVMVLSKSRKAVFTAN